MVFLLFFIQNTFNNVYEYSFFYFLSFKIFDYKMICFIKYKKKSYKRKDYNFFITQYFHSLNAHTPWLITYRPSRHSSYFLTKIALRLLFFIFFIIYTFKFYLFDQYLISSFSFQMATFSKLKLNNNAYSHIVFIQAI